ncbi:MAG TPA: hypothetical protein VGE07_30630 [Herpetosiphonaceae bacterium]
MLAPDPTAAQAQLQGGVNAAQLVTRYSQAAATLVPAYQRAILDPTLRQQLTTLTIHAGQWRASLCPAYNQQIPDAFIRFSATFGDSAAAMDAAGRRLAANPGDQAARQQLTGELSGLQAALGDLGGPLDDLKSRLAAYDGVLQGDYAALGAALAQFARGIAGGDQIVQSVQASLGLDYLNSTVLGPCIAIVELRSEIAVSVNQAAGNQPGVIGLVLGQSVAGALQQNNAAATSALSNVLETWQSLIGKYQAVSQQLAQASQGELGGIIQSLEIDAAAAAWRQLAQFAASISGSRV